MNRRTLLKLAPLAALGAAPATAVLASQQPGLPRPVDRVLVVFKCHLDVGFTQTQAAVMRKYFDVFYPQAIRLAASLREAGRDRYTWTTGSWLLYEYLDQAAPAQRAVMEQAIAHGDIAWHALPFSWQTEMLDRSMIDGALGFSAALDRRFGQRTIGAKMTDVPGHTRGLIAPLAAGGIQFLDIGVNAASTPPDVPDVFLWKNAAGQSVIVMYHRHDYGSTLQVPGSSLAVSVQVRNDNSGPHTPEEIAALYAGLRQRFPGASIQAASLSDVARAVEPFRTGLPVFTREIGDTWIYGVPSDPPKVARYREVARLRQGWIADKHFAAGDATDLQLLRRLLLSVEHTWGTDTKTYLDNQHYRPADLDRVLGEPGYRTMTTSWQEKRDDLDLGLATLPEPLHRQARTALAALIPTAPVTEGLQKLDPTVPIHTSHFTLALNPRTGAIISLIPRREFPMPGENLADWASPQSPLALFTYQTLSAPDFAGFLDRYIKSKEDWAPRDFGKPGIEAFGAQSREWHPTLQEAWTATTPTETRIVLRLSIEDPRALATGSVAWPATLFMEYLLPSAQTKSTHTIQLRLTTFGKRANRLPEAMWLTFLPPSISPSTCTFSKTDQLVVPMDVIRGGSRAMHALSGPITFGRRDGGALNVTSIDAPVIAFGERSPLNFSLDPPSFQKGVHFSLFNNAWGTNYPQWAQGDWAYRFTLSA